MADTEAAKEDLNMFDPDSYSFKATVLGVSVALLVFITCSVGIAGVRHLRRSRPKKEAVDLEAGQKGGTRM